MVPEVLIERFNAKWKADPKTGCWMWTASTHSRGYGQIKLPKQRKQIPAHRLSYLIHRGEIPEGMQICHKCDTPLCVNPEHLFMGTIGDNMKDKVSKGRQDRGESHGGSRLTETQVLEILALVKAGEPQMKIAEQFGVSQITVSRIKRGTRWSWLITEPLPGVPYKKPMTPHQIRQVKNMLATGVEGASIARAFKTSPVTISRIKLGKRWTDI